MKHFLKEKREKRKEELQQQPKTTKIYLNKMSGEMQSSAGISFHIRI